MIRTDSSEYNNTSVGYRPRESCFASDFKSINIISNYSYISYRIFYEKGFIKTKDKQM